MRPSAWAEGRKGLVDTGCEKPALKTSTPFLPFPISSQWLGLVGREVPLQGEGFLGLLRSVFRG